MQIRPRAVDPEGASLRYRALRAFIMAAIAKWRRRSRTRRQLRALNDRELNDVGLSPEARQRESAKWFWQR
jgi:uncharacterized protein YjiS (DUF1127 family)